MPDDLNDEMPLGVSIGIGTLRYSRHDVLHQADAIKVTEDKRGTRLGFLETGRNRELARQKAARTRGIDKEIRAQLEWGAVPRTAHAHGIRRDARARQGYAIAIVDAGGDCLSHEMVIHVGAEPVRVRE